MSAEVHRLTAAGPVIGPERDVVRLLEELLEEAKRGEIAGFGVSLVKASGGLQTAYASGCADRHMMLSGASMLHHRMNVAIASDP